MKIKRFSVFFCFIASVAIFSSCRQDLLDSPNIYTGLSYSKGEILPPEKITATQGGYRSITLTWASSKYAKNYEIYSSDTSTGEFIKIGETSDATCNYTSSENPGILKYFKVRAVKEVDNKNVLSEFSTTCFGTTLATPAITWVKQSANGDAITVKWYKGVNCTPKTYLNSELNYTVILWNADSTKVLKEVTIAATEVANDADTVYTFTGLEPNTNYNVQVKAYKKSAQNNTESSDPENQSTAHSLVPAGPESLAVTKGTSKDEVKVSWILPKFAEIKTSTAYESRPVYFKIYKKLESAPDYAYSSIVTYLGSVKQNSPSASVIYFEKKTGATPEESNVTVTPKGSILVEYPTEETETDQNYKNYIPGTKITYIDKDVKVGEKYSYRVQSFIDDNGKKLITSDESYAEESGWLINTPSISVSSTYKEKPKENEADSAKVESFSVVLNFKFDDFGQSYNYVIEETCQKIKKIKKASGEGTEDTVEEENKNYLQSTSYSIFPKEFNYKPIYDENYYQKYTYAVYILDASSESSDVSKAYISVAAPGSVIVINDMSMMPSVDDFFIKDGYKDCFLLSWTYNKDCKYTLSWKDNDSTQINSLVLDNAELEKNVNEKGLVIFKHSANSGDIRKDYTLTANNGMEKSKTLPPPESEVGGYKTLGTPKPYFEPNYKSVKILWKPVQKAKGYKITASYKGTLIVEKNISENQTDEDGNLTCEITEPYGKTKSGEVEAFNTTNAEIAGEKIDFTIEAYSVDSDGKTQLDTTQSPADFKVFTLGPGAIEYSKEDGAASKIEKGFFIEGTTDRITLRWNSVQGANGYLIVRKKYSENYYSDLKNKADVYFYSETNNSLSLLNESSDIKESTSCTKTANEITFKDIYKPAQNYENQYEIDQAQIKWGFPYGYTIIPVLKDSDFKMADLEIEGTENSISYTSDSLSKVEKTDSTYGYGHGLNASKATTKSTVKLSWKEPYKKEQKPTIYYRSYNAANGSEWQKEDFSNSLNTAQVAPKDSYKAYDYLACYSPDAPERLKVDLCFEDYIARQKDGNDEKNNKGYILSFEAPAAKYGGNLSGDDYKKDNYYYSEKLSWSKYNTEEKKQGFDKAELFMLNTNKKDGWVKIVDLNPSDFSVKDRNVADSKYDLLIENPNATAVTLMPQSIRNGTATNTDGLLKVLRDAKHYYMLKASRTFKDEEGKNQTIEISVGDKGSVYAYRQITDEELVKATMLVIADAIKASKMEDYGTGTAFGDSKPVYGYDSTEKTGKFTWEQDASSRFDWNISSFIYGWDKLPYQNFSSVAELTDKGKLINFLTVSDAEGLSGDFKRGRKSSKTLEYLSIRKLESSILGIKSYKDFDLNEKIPLTVTASQEPFTSLASYSATVKFASSNSEFAVEVERDGSKTFSKNVSGAEEVKTWLPADINGNGYNGQNSTYGWWEN